MHNGNKPPIISDRKHSCEPIPPMKPKKPLQFKRGTAKAFYKANPILLEGQPAVELDTHKLKIGDGFTKYRQLPYIGNGEVGEDGKSAYQLWKEQGNEGTVNDFLQYLVGPTGLSAYEVWLSVGNKGDMSDFIISLQGDSAYDLWVKEGNKGSVSDFLESLKGKSAYDIWISIGNVGTEKDFINSLKGLSAYEVWLEEGNEGTVDDFFNSLKGKDGKSAYEIYVDGGGTLKETEFIQSILTPSQWGTF